MDEGVLEKARKLFALADPSRGAGAEESHVAWVKLHALMKAHGMKLSDVTGQGEDDEDLPVRIASFDHSMPPRRKVDEKWVWHGEKVAEILRIQVEPYGTVRIAGWQKEHLVGSKIDPETVRTCEAAERILTELRRRRMHGLASASQCCWLAEKGLALDYRNLRREKAAEYFTR